MAINDISTATKYTEQLDKMYVQKAVTGFLADNAFRAKFVGAKTVMMPTMEFVGLTNYDRDNGFSKATTTIAHETFTLSQDRGRTLQIDREDMDEAGVANLAGQVLSEYIRTQVVPETDAYVMSKLYQAAGKGGNADKRYTGKISELLDIINAAHDAAGYDEELVAFVDPKLWSALMTSNELSRQITVSDFKQGDLNFKVKSINGVSLIPVTSTRMRVDFEFYDGTGAGSGGFSPLLGADYINAIVMPKNGASLVRKTETLRIFTPEQNLNADAYKFDYRIYYDVFVKDSNCTKIFTLTSSAD